MERKDNMFRFVWLCAILSVLVMATLMQGCAVAAGAAAGAGAGYVAGHEAGEEEAEEELGVDD
jgi:hypothetical protein